MTIYFSHPMLANKHGTQMIDKINTRYGEGTLLPASLLHYPDFSPVIAPAWQPTAHANLFTM